MYLSFPSRPTPSGEPGFEARPGEDISEKGIKAFIKKVMHMLCCGCLFVELIDRREGVLWKQKRNTREGQRGGGSRVVIFQGCGLFPWLIEPIHRLFMKSFSFKHLLCSRHLNGCFW